LISLSCQEDAMPAFRTLFRTLFRNVSALSVVLLLTACASSGPQPGSVQRLSPEELARIRPVARPVVGLEEIIARTKTGQTPEAIIARLRETGTVHVLSSAQIVDLSRQGVDQKVIDYLAEAQEKARQATLTTQLADRDTHTGTPVNVTEVVMLDARLLGIEEGAEDYLASVDFSGMIRENPSTGPAPFREVWNMSKPKDGSAGWLVAGVQALQ
jgi:hypothetical protein